uniref:Uncharacterized protein n=1 Tax=Romanomermis culicivorax TaxID=13658 RepID=A0A915HMJ5_ROMCU
MKTKNEKEIHEKYDFLTFSFNEKYNQTVSHYVHRQRFDGVFSVVVVIFVVVRYKRRQSEIDALSFAFRDVRDGQRFVQRIPPGAVGYTAMIGEFFIFAHRARFVIVFGHMSVFRRIC